MERFPLTVELQQKEGLKRWSKDRVPQRIGRNRISPRSHRRESNPVLVSHGSQTKRHPANDNELAHGIPP
jgi:hypothetical protein